MGTLLARCGAPATESCTFKLTLFANIRSGRKIRRVNLGSVTGRLKGGVSGKLTVRLNALGRKLLARGPLHVAASNFHVSLTVKRVIPKAKKKKKK